MSITQNGGRQWLVIVILLLLISLVAGQVWAVDSNSEFLKYQEPKPPEVSWFSSIAYIITLLFTFAVVIILAYFTSRFLGYKMGTTAATGNPNILDILPLGTNRAVYVVEVAGKIMILGVTDHSIQLLQEITASEEILSLKNRPPHSANQFEKIFQGQLNSLQHISKKFSATFDIQSESKRKNE